jgi:hypothetical protein
VLHAARRAIGPDALRLRDGVVALEAQVDVDAPRPRGSTRAPPARPPTTSPRSTCTPANSRPRTATSPGPTRAGPRRSSPWRPMHELAGLTATTRPRWPRCSARWSSTAGRARAPALMRPPRHRASPAGPRSTSCCANS